MQWGNCVSEASPNAHVASNIVVFGAVVVGESSLYKYLGGM